MSKFRRGENVRIVNDEYPGTGLLIGSVHPIHKVVAGGYELIATEGESAGEDYFYFEERLELVTPETPKASSKFYVAMVHENRIFETLEEAEKCAKERAEYNNEDTYVVFQPLKAFRVNTEAQEVTLA